MLITYLRLAVWPDALCFAYDLMPPKSFGEIVAPALAIVALLGLTGWAVVKRPALGFLGAAFFLILAPTSSIVPILDAAFEHRMYLPLATLVSLAVIGGYSLWTIAPATPSHAPRTTHHASWRALSASWQAL